MRVQFTKAAEDDLTAIYDYTLKTWGVEQADSYLDDLRQRIGSQLWRPAAYWREDAFVLKARKHLMFGVFGEDVITIVRVLHQRQDPLRHLPLLSSEG